jgi:hypothetical protein
LSTLARAVFLALVAATFGAFFVAQRLKGSPPVVELRGVRWFSPNGDGRKDTSAIRLRIRESDVLTADVVDAAGNVVRRLATEQAVTPSQALRLQWDGRSDDGGVAPDGLYRIRASLARQGRSVIVPRLITLDTTPPRPRIVRIKPRAVPGLASQQVVGPTAPPMAIDVRGISRLRATRFRVYRTDLPEPRLVSKGTRAPGLRRWTWNGRSRGKPVPPGVYLVQVAVRDRAGNVGLTPRDVPPQDGAPTGPAGITVRSVAVQPPLQPVTAGRRAEFFVDSRGRAYRWALRRAGREIPVREGRVRAGPARPLRVKAPDADSGLYLLEVRAGRGRTSVPLLVQSRDRATLLVVVPAITWLGTDPVDDPPLRDGMPDTLTALGGGRVRWPRVFAGENGLPAGLAQQVAPLLIFLDRARVRYDLTSDLDLALSESPRATDRKAVLLAGSHRWVTRPLARRLRRYALDGGRVAVFGTETLRRGVTLRANGPETAGELLRPTEATPEDPFGAVLDPVRRSEDGPIPIEPVAGDATSELLIGFDGTLDGFSAVEESAPPDPDGRARLTVALGEPPPEPPPDAAPDAPLPEERYALTAVRLGEGLVVRVGLPEWTARLREPEVAQITRNVVDVLRGVEPRFRPTN